MQHNKANATSSFDGRCPAEISGYSGDCDDIQILHLLANKN